MNPTTTTTTALKTLLALGLLMPMGAIPALAAPHAPSLNARADLSLADLLDQVRPSVVKIETERGLGTGFVVRKDGLILTAAHVVEGAKTVRVRFADGRAVQATHVLKTDTTSDYALLKIEGENYPALSLADSETLRQGEKVFTLGTPVGLDFTASEGIVSALRNTEGRSVSRGGGVTYIQLTAPISPGNSGGPVFNARGEVLGIAVFKRTDGENLNFALAINRAKEALANPGEGVALGGMVEVQQAPEATQTAAWFIVATQNTGGVEQVLDTIADPDPLIDREALNQRRRSGFQIVDIAESGKGWVLTLNRTTEVVNTNVVTSSTFPGEDLQEALNRGEQISSVVYGHGRWVVVFSRYTGSRQQVVKVGPSYPQDWIDTRSAQGYRVTAIQEAGGEWVTVMTRGTALEDQVTLGCASFPKEWLESKWAEGYRVTALGSAKGGFVVVMSKGSGLGAQVACTDKDLPVAWIRTCIEKGLILTIMR